jgi:hypothetical protein
MYLQYNSMKLKVFKCVWMHLEYVLMYFNVFTKIVIGISPLHSQYKIYAMRIHLHIYFSLSIMTPFST